MMGKILRVTDIERLKKDVDDDEYLLSHVRDVIRSHEALRAEVERLTKERDEAVAARSATGMQNVKLIHDIDDLRWQVSGPKQQGAAEERAKVVAWLGVASRANGVLLSSDQVTHIMAAIERGEHDKGGGK